MTASHTPGPWSQGSGASTGEGYAICAGPCIVATVVGLGYPIGKGRAPVSDANARLIAAAPDLLAALQEIAETIEVALDRGLFLSVDGKRPDVMALLDAKRAIAKATGQ